MQFLALQACHSSATTRPDDADGPLVWVAARGDARVHLFGFGEARNRSWLSARVQRAFEESRQLWFEVPPPSTPGTSPLVQSMGYDSGRNLSEVLGPALWARTRKAAEELGIPEQRLQSMRPWLAREAIQRAYQGSGKAQAVASDYADTVLRERAHAAGKAVHYEFATFDDVIRLFATMSEEAQREYLTNMLDYLDGKLGTHADSGWIHGRPRSDSIDRMRLDTPALYHVMHVTRNRDWAARIDHLLKQGGTHMVVVGLNHTLGPNSIQKELQALGLTVRALE